MIKVQKEKVPICFLTSIPTSRLCSSRYTEGEDTGASVAGCLSGPKEELDQ